MRVLFISHSAGLNGAERSLLDLVIGIQSYGVQPTVVLPRRGPLLAELEKNNINCVVHLYHNWIGRNYKIIKGLCRFIINQASVPGLIKKLKGREFDLVYSNSLATPVGAMVAKSIGVKHVWHARELVEGMDMGFDYGIDRSAHFIAMNSCHMIYNSCAVEKKFGPLLESSPGTVVYNGWLVGDPPSDLDVSSLVLGTPIKLCIVGYVYKGKGQHQAIKALAVLKRSFPNMTLDIVGAGDSSYIREIEALCFTLGISESVSWPGFENDVAAVFRRSDISLVCSRNEAFGRVVVEAMAEGCPVVGSCSGGIPEIIEHGVNGLLYNYESVDDLVRQVSVLINNQELYSKIARRGVIDAYKRFSRRRYAEQIHQVLKEL